MCLAHKSGDVSRMNEILVNGYTYELRILIQITTGKILSERKSVTVSKPRLTWFSSVARPEAYLAYSVAPNVQISFLQPHLSLQVAKWRRASTFIFETILWIIWDFFIWNALKLNVIWKIMICNMYFILIFRNFLLRKNMYKKFNFYLFQRKMETVIC